MLEFQIWLLVNFSSESVKILDLIPLQCWIWFFFNLKFHLVQQVFVFSVWLITSMLVVDTDLNDEFRS